MKSFAFCSYTKECFPQVTANMMAAMEVADLTSNAERNKQNIQT